MNVIKLPVKLKESTDKGTNIIYDKDGVVIAVVPNNKIAKQLVNIINTNEPIS